MEKEKRILKFILTRSKLRRCIMLLEPECAVHRHEIFVRYGLTKYKLNVLLNAYINSDKIAIYPTEKDLKANTNKKIVDFAISKFKSPEKTKKEPEGITPIANDEMSYGYVINPIPRLRYVFSDEMVGRKTTSI